MFLLEEIRQRIGEYKPVLFDIEKEKRQAAVAIVLARADEGIDVLFIKRAEFEGDPWSGHMSFPGGHRDDLDKNLRSAAERETFEEIGLALQECEYCGTLSHQRTFGRGNRPGMLVAPYVYVRDRKFEPELSSEVEAVVWGSLEGMLNRSLHGTEERLSGTQAMTFNGYKLGVNRFVWGLTYRTLQELFQVLDPSYKVPAEAS